MKNARICSIFFTVLLVFSFFLIYQPTIAQTSKCSIEVGSEFISIFYVISALNDTDGDGMPDDWELLYDLDPEYDDSRLDMDWDLLENLEEYIYNTNPWVPDSDGDGFDDGFEVTKGTNPANPKDHPVRIWLIILISFLSIGIIAFATWVIYITKQDSKVKSKEKK